MLRLTRTLTLAGLAVLSLAACSDSTGPSDELAGVYTLITIDGESLPVIVDQNGDDIAEITEGTLTLDDDGSFDDVTELRITESGQVTTEEDATSGNWSVSGTTVTFDPIGTAGNYTMTWDGQNRLTQNFQGFILVYERD
jgi:hypothetical protein